MGGTGSTRWELHRKRRTVEETFAICISDVTRVVDLKNTGSGSGAVQPVKPSTCKKVSPVRCVVEHGEDDTPLLTLSYPIPNRWGFEYRIKDMVRLQTTRPHFGGVRWWFSCPRQGCARRVGKLHRIPEERYFACRDCLDLSYRSSQQAHKYDSFCRRAADEDSGEVFSVVKEAFTPAKRGTGGRGAEAAPTLLNAFQKVFGERKE